MKNLATKRLKLIEVQTAPIDELLEAQHKVAISSGSNWDMLSYNRGLLDRELSKRSAMEATAKRNHQIAKDHAEDEILIANS